MFDAATRPACLEFQTGHLPSTRELLADDAKDAEQLRLHTREYMIIWLLRRRLRIRTLKEIYKWPVRRIGAAMHINISEISRLSRIMDEKAHEIIQASDHAAATDPTFEYPSLMKILELANVVGDLDVHFMRGKNNHPTPWPIVRRAAWELGLEEFDVDVCGTEQNKKARRVITETENGLVQAWHGNVWCNPPYGQSDWIRKCAEHPTKTGAKAAYLGAARTDTLWFRDYASRGRIILFTGRPVFLGSVRPCPFPTMLVVFDGAKRDGERLDVTLEPVPID